MKKSSTSFIALLALIVLLSGCIKENLADCNFNISVEFIEQGNCNNGSLYGEAGSITVFAFNEAGIFVDQFSDGHAVFGSAYKLPVSLPQGNYTLVAWAGFANSQFNVERLVKGRTTLNELYMPSYSLRNGQKEAACQPFFTGNISHVNSIEGNTQVIGLAGTAKPLKINVSGLPSAHSYQARISDNAVHYKFENSLLSILADDHYTMANLVESSGAPSNCKAETSLLWPVGRYTPQLTIRDLTTGADVFNADIKAMLAQLTQLDFDCEQAINIDITVNQTNAIQVGVVINGWKVQYINNEI